jgi:hypothetical protein
LFLNEQPKRQLRRAGWKKRIVKKSEEGNSKTQSPIGLFRSLGLNFSGWLSAEASSP